MLRCLLLPLLANAWFAAQDTPAKLSAPDPFLSQARQNVIDASEILERFLCDEHIERWHRDAPVAPWHRKDLIDAEVGFDRGTGERYRDIRVNGNPTTSRMLDLGGSNSLGEFALDLRNLFGSIGNDSFHLVRIETHAGKSIRVYSYVVEQDSSNWKIQDGSHGLIPAFDGTLWIDPQGGQVVRLEMRARNLPRDFPQHVVSDIVEYGPVTISPGKPRYLPTAGEALFCNADGGCDRNLIHFDKYRLFTAESMLTFTPPKTFVAPVMLPPPASVAIPAPWNPVAIHFVGIAHPLSRTTLTLELDDTRYLIVDLPSPTSFPIQSGDRVQVATTQYDGRGLLAESIGKIARVTPTMPVHTTVAPPADANTDSIVQQARQTEAELLRSLPNYLCTQNVTRYQNWPDSRGWEVLDRLSADVVYRRELGENYHNIRVNGKSTAKRWEDLGGDISTGEFGTVLRSILAEGTAFAFVKNTRISGMAVSEYTFSVPRAHSNWRVRIDYQFIVPAYSGRIWIDREFGRVLRLERTVEDIPPQFPIRSVSDKLTFGPIRLRHSHADLLPIRAETVLCMRKSKSCSRKIMEFRNYRLFTADSKLKF